MPDDAKQSAGSPWWIVALAMMASALLLGRLPSTGSVPAPTRSPQSPAEESGAGSASSGVLSLVMREDSPQAKRERRLLSPLSKYFGADQPLNLAGITERLQAERHDSRFQLDFLIVVVADPVESAISYSFDLQLDSLHRAMAAENLIPDAFYMPWDPVARKDQPWRSEPGVLLFRQGLTRRTVEKPGLLLVLLVGEQPTTGIHQAAFRESVQLIGKLRGFRPEGHQDEIMVGGITFTGSAPSLARAIRDAQEEIVTSRTAWPAETRLSFEVLTGAAIGVDLRAFEENARHPRIKNKVEFGATVGHVAPLKDELVHYVCRRSFLGTPRIAWLTESVTGFGAASKSADNKRQQSSEKTPEILELPFPVNIARVRATYERVRSEQAAKAPAGVAERYRLGIPFDDVQESSDLPPLFTPRITAPTNELVLGQIMEMIRREGIQYVGISASDIRDPIFLSQVIRQYCPEVQILLVTSDLVHLHPSYRSAMRGTLVASSYPYFPDAQNWCYPRQGAQRRIVLSNQELFGFYNAVRLLRGRQTGSIQLDDSTGTPSPLTYAVDERAQLLAYGQPLGEPPHQPPVWISMIGNDGIWPLESHPYPREGAYADYLVAAQPPKEKTSATDHQSHGSVHFTPMSYASQFTWAIFGLVIAAGAAGKLRISPLRPLAYDSERSLRQQRWFRWTLGFFLLLLALLVEVHTLLALTSLVVCSQGTPMAREFTTHWRETLGVGISTAAMAFILGTMYSVVFRGRTAATWPAIAAGLVVEIVFLALFVAVVGRATDPANLLLWTQYMTEEFNGVSPLLTLKLTLLATIALLYGLLKQLYLLRTEFHSRPRRQADARREHTRDTQRRLMFPVWQRYVRDSQKAHGVRSPRIASQSHIMHRWWVLVDEAWTMMNSIFIPFGAALLVGLLLIWLGWMTLVADASWLLLRFTVGLLLAACAYWALRLIKAIELVNQCDAQMDELFRQIGGDDCRRVWEEVLGNRKGDELAGLRRFLRPQPHVKASRLAELRVRLRTLEPKPGDTLTQDQLECRTKIENEIFAFRVEVYAYQYFAHLRRLAAWLLVTAILLYMAVTSYPLNTAGWFRLLAATMIATLGGAMVWGYLKLDRNELLSLITGTTPYQLHWDWSLVGRLGPVVAFGALALLGAAFPELWQWISMISEPLVVPMK